MEASLTEDDAKSVASDSRWVKKILWTILVAVLGGSGSIVTILLHHTEMTSRLIEVVDSLKTITSRHDGELIAHRNKIEQLMQLEASFYDRGRVEDNEFRTIQNRLEQHTGAITDAIKLIYAAIDKAGDAQAQAATLRAVVSEMQRRIDSLEHVKAEKTSRTR